VGVKVNSVWVNNIRYADDTVLIADNMEDLLTNTDFDLASRIRFVKCYVWTVLLYGMEGWTVKVSTMNKLEAFEMLVYRRVLRFPARRTNDEVLRIINIDCKLLDTILLLVVPIRYGCWQSAWRA